MKQLLDKGREAKRKARGLNPVPSRPVKRSLSSVTANVQQGSHAPAFPVSAVTEAHDLDVARKALRIAIEGCERIDELSLIGYPTSLDPATKEVVETALFYVARGVLES